MANRGFTLIELLVVVAIIGILAAIAVPNFADSLVRAKIARMQHDAGTLGMAIETYRSDYGWYPYGKDCDPTKKLCSVYGLSETVRMEKLPQIISPIAYITTIPLDLFNWPEDHLNYTLTYSHLFQQTILAFCSDAAPSTKRTSWTYSVYSVGPDGKASQYYDLAYWMQMPYNPSNGIRSLGDIQWSMQLPPVWDGGSRK